MKYLVTAVILLTAVIQIKGLPDYIQRINIGQGLPNATIADMDQDSKGFLWFATKQGLCRFDGNRFISYTTANSGISGNELNMLLIDSIRSKIWIATERDGLSLFDSGSRTFQSFKHDPDDMFSISSDEITDLDLDQNGGIWIANYSAGIDYLNPSLREFSHFNQDNVKGMPKDHIWSICSDRRNLLYVGHLKSGLTVLSVSSKTAKNFRRNNRNNFSIPSNEVICIFIDPQKNVWIGTREGLALFNPETETFRTFKHIPTDEFSLLSDQIYDIDCRNGEELWLACRMGGISILNLKQDIHNPHAKIIFENLRAGDKDSRVSSIHISSVKNDSYGNIWVGFEGDGLNFIPHETIPFKTWQHTPSKDFQFSLRGYVPVSLCLQSGRDIWVGEDAAGVDFFSNGIKVPEKTGAINRILGNTLVQSIFKDSQGVIWFGTFLKGILCYDPHTGNLKQLNPEPSLPIHVRCMYEDSGGTIWIGTHHGVYLYDPISKTFDKPDSVNAAIQDNILRNITGDQAGNIYIATFGKGLSQFSPERELIAFQDIRKGFPSNAVNTLYCDFKGDMWAGTRKGLVHFQAVDGKINLNQYKVYNEQNGLSDACIRSIEEDNYGNLWMGTNSGLSNFQRAENIFYNYTTKDGLPGGEFQDNASVVDASGCLYFVSRHGVTYFNPHDFYQDIPLPEAIITEVSLLGRQNELQEQNIPLPERNREIKLTNDQNTLNISFGIPDFAFANRIEFAYRLEGLDKEWYNCKEQHVIFRNLPPGNYSFHLKYRFKGKEWITLSEQLNIRVLHPWWLTGWAKLSYSIVFIFIALIVFHIYKRRQQLENHLFIEKENHKKDQEIHNERMIFFTNIAHELRTPLTLILGPLEDLMRTESNSSSKFARISMIYRNASRLRELTNQILEFRKTETQNRKLCVQFNSLETIVRESVLHFSESNNNKRLQITHEFRTEDMLCWHDREIISIILNNLLSNAIKYTEQGKIILSVHEESSEGVDYIILTVSDTGEGIPEKELPHIFNRYYQIRKEQQNSGTGIGLALVKNLADLHQALITVQSKAHSGASFSLWLRKGYDYPETEHISPLRSMEKEFPAEIQEPDNQKPSLLIIEDHAEIREYIKESLEDEYQLSMASNGKEGVEKAFSLIPDLIISDILMPELNGIELSKILKNDINTSHIPIILLTAKDSSEEKSEGYEAGADSYLTKPFNSVLLKSRISNILHTRLKLMDMWKKQSPFPLFDKKGLNQLDEIFLESLTKIIHEQIDSTEIDITFIGRKLNMSYSTLYRKTKMLTGLTINAFILRVKMYRAAELLKTKQFSVFEVMYHVGMNTPAYFRKCFKDTFGCLPSEYK